MEKKSQFNRVKHREQQQSKKKKTFCRFLDSTNVQKLNKIVINFISFEMDGWMNACGR